MQAQEKFWDKRAGGYEIAIQGHSIEYNQRIERVTSLVDETDIVLDFGCASGEISLDIVPAVNHLHGIDLSGVMIESAKSKARLRGVDNVVFDQMDLFDASLERESFTAILAFHVLHLLEDPAKGLARLRDLLIPGGLLITETPCLGEWNWAAKSLIKSAVAVGMAPTVQGFSATQLRTLISDQGFKILEVEPAGKKNSKLILLARKSQ